MSWATVDLEFAALIRRACTPAQFDAVKLKAAGYGRRRIARILGISPAATRERLDAAQRNIEAELARTCPSPGCWTPLVEGTRGCPAHGPSPPTAGGVA